MARIALTCGEQIILLLRAQQQLQVTQVEMARMCGVHPRTFSDWMQGKCRMRYDCFQCLIKQSGLSFEREVKQLPEFSHVRMAARLGAAKRNRLHGNPGTSAGRRLGGLVSVTRRQQAAANGVGPIDTFRLAKTIRYPEPSPELAEFFGIMLGDGCLSGAYQVALYFNTETDASYADFMEQLTYRLFDIVPRRSVESGSRAGTLLFSSRRFVECLLQLGFCAGDKVTQQAGVPDWISVNMGYRRSCLRGLMDTDGSVYRYSHTIFGRSYRHVALCFTNRSHPLLGFVEETLRADGYRPVRARFRIYLYRQSEIERYFADIETHNDKHRQRFQTYAQGQRARLRRGTQVVDGAALEKR